MRRLSVEELPEVFADVTPIPQDDGPAAVAKIDYKADFRTAHDYFRALLRQYSEDGSDEFTGSDRAIALTTLCLQFNPANYTVWYYRRQCLQLQLKRATSQEAEAVLSNILDEEMALAAMLGGDNPKNYQIWYHRRALLELLMSMATSTPNGPLIDMYGGKELAYIHSVILSDGKNYHAWSQRQWVVQTMLADAWQSEITYTDSLIRQDPRNNSAWNHRWFCIHKGKPNNKEDAVVVEVLEAEAAYAVEIATLDAYNESPWRYWIAIVKEQKESLDDNDARSALLSQHLETLWKLRAQVEQSTGNGAATSVSLLAAAIDVLEWQGTRESLQQVMDLSNDLATHHDAIRQKYWKRRVQLAQSKLESM